MKLVVCVTGASGAVYARRLLSLLDSRVASPDLGPGVESPLRVDWVASRYAEQVWETELGVPVPDYPALTRWPRHDFSAPFASGSSAPDAVIVIPCSVTTLARIAHGIGEDLIARVADVALKERRRLILVVREAPLSLVHLRNMLAITAAAQPTPERTSMASSGQFSPQAPHSMQASRSTIRALRSSTTKTA